jgi:sugar lactone lactonase YvrE
MNSRNLITFILLALIAGCDGGNPTEQTQKAAPEPETSLTILARGADIAGANGILFSPDGLLYVASVIGSNITIIDPDSGVIFNQLDSTDGVIGPDDLAFSDDGAFFWTSILTGEVGGFNAKGEKVIAAQLGPGVNPITFSDDGRLFVSQCFFDTNLYEIDPKGKKPARLISDELGPGCGLNGMDWGPDNRLYGPRWFTGEVVSFNVDDNTMRVEATGFDTPAAVKFDNAGQLHVLDTGTGEVIKLDKDQKIIIATLSPGLDNFAFDKNDQLFVSSFIDGFVKRVESDGTLTTLLPSGMAHPGGITLLGDKLVVADMNAIRFFDKKTGEQTNIQRNVLGTGKMGGAINVSVDGNNLILVSWLDNDVRVWDPVAEEVVERYSGLSAPVDAVRFAGKIIVTEHGSNQVTALDESGSMPLLNFAAPSGLAVDGDDLYLTDREGGSIYKIGAGNAILEKPELITKGLESPEGLVITNSGFAVVEADSGHIVNINALGEKKLLATIPAGSAASTETQPPSMIFNGVTIDENGIIYVTGETSRMLYKIE